MGSTRLPPTQDFAVEDTDESRSFRVQLAATNPIIYLAK
jgi:hypothetical protein